MRVDRVGEKREGLTTGEVLSQVYLDIIRKYPGYKIPFKKGVLCRVASSGDYGRRKRETEGDMVFDMASVIQVGNGKGRWVLALATKTEGWPAADFASELKMFGVSCARGGEEIKEMIARRHGFRGSVLIGTTFSGFTAVTEIGKQVLEILREEGRSFVVKEADFCEPGPKELGPSPHFVKSQMQLSPEVVGVIAGKIIQILEGGVKKGSSTISFSFRK